MTIRRIVARVSMICLIPALALAQDTPAGAPDAAPGASVLQVHDAPDQIIHVTTRIRHTTVIQLPHARPFSISLWATPNTGTCPAPRISPF